MDSTLGDAAGVPLPESTSTSRASSRPSSPTRPAVQDWQIRMKSKKIIKPMGSLLSMKATSPRIRLKDTFASSPYDQGKSSGASTPTMSHEATKPESKDDDDKVLEDLLSSAKMPAAGSLNVKKQKGGAALPSLIAGLTKQRNPSQTSSLSGTSTPTSITTKLSDSVSLDILDQHHDRAGSIRSLASTTSDTSYASHDSHETVRDGDSRSGTRTKSSEAYKGIPAPLTDSESASKGSTLSSLSGFLHRNLRGNRFLGQGGIPTADDDGLGPHIKQTIQHGDTKLTCTVYYAQQFEKLRAACGISEELFTDSLSRCSVLAVTGGKTSAGFYLTQDKRFVLKEMVSPACIIIRRWLTYCNSEQAGMFLS